MPVKMLCSFEAYKHRGDYDTVYGLLALYWLLVDTSPDPGLPHHHVVCEASVDTHSVTKMKNVLGAERNLFKIPKTDMIKSLKLLFRW